MYMKFWINLNLEHRCPPLFHDNKPISNLNEIANMFNIASLQLLAEDIAHNINTVRTQHDSNDRGSAVHDATTDSDINNEPIFKTSDTPVSDK